MQTTIMDTVSDTLKINNSVSFGLMVEPMVEICYISIDFWIEEIDRLNWLV